MNSLVRLFDAFVGWTNDTDPVVGEDTFAVKLGVSGVHFLSSTSGFFRLISSGDFVDAVITLGDNNFCHTVFSFLNELNVVLDSAIGKKDGVHSSENSGIILRRPMREIIIAGVYWNTSRSQYTTLVLSLYTGRMGTKLLKSGNIKMRVKTNHQNKNYD